MRLALPLLIGTVALLVAIFAVKLSSKLGLPSLLVYLGIGVLLGTSGIGIDFSNTTLARDLGTLALVIILAEGGLTTRWREVRPHIALSIALSTVSVVVSVAVMTAFMVLVLQMHWQLAVVTAAIISSTDAAAVFSVLRTIGLPSRITSALEVESGMNDAPVILLVTFLSVPVAQMLPWWQIGLLVTYELLAGAALGALIGLISVQIMRRGALPSAGLYPVLAIGLLMLTYEVTVLLSASGFMAVYVAGVILGNANLPFKRYVLGFSEGLAWLAQIGLFIMLGLLVFPAEIPSVLLPALLIGLVLLLVARPLSVAAAAAPLRVPLRVQAFLSWAGLRGAVPIVLATIPISYGLPRSWDILHMVFVLVVVFTLLQGTTLPLVARQLHLAGTAQTRDLEVDVVALDEIGTDLLTVDVADSSRLHGVYVKDLRLPAPALVSLVVREGKTFVPDVDTRLRAGDRFLVVATREIRELTEQRLRAVARSGRLARWYGDDGRRERAS